MNRLSFSLVILLRSLSWVAGEARPASFHSSYLNATPSNSASGFINLSQSGGENLYVHIHAVRQESDKHKICNTMDRCRKRFEDATRKAEVLVDNV